MVGEGITTVTTIGFDQTELSIANSYTYNGDDLHKQIPPLPSALISYYNASWADE
jgi:hypothetical protein